MIDNKCLNLGVPLGVRPFSERVTIVCLLATVAILIPTHFIPLTFLAPSSPPLAKGSCEETDFNAGPSSRLLTRAVLTGNDLQDRDRKEAGRSCITSQLQGNYRGMPPASVTSSNASVLESQAKASSSWTVLLDGQSMRGWRPLNRTKTNEWQVCGAVKLNPQDDHLFAIEPGSGVLVNGRKGETTNLLSETHHGDVEAHIEFTVPRESNSGIYFMGLYEIQVFDSFGKTELSNRDCGAVFSRSRASKGFLGAAPRVNASKPPGEWQSFDVQFRAPRFDSNGKKVAHAKFLKVIHNGKVIHENVEVDGPTEGAIATEESLRGPLMVQGDHGSVAYRNIRIRALE